MSVGAQPYSLRLDYIGTIAVYSSNPVSSLEVHDQDEGPELTAHSPYDKASRIRTPGSSASSIRPYCAIPATIMNQRRRLGTPMDYAGSRTAGNGAGTEGRADEAQLVRRMKCASNHHD